MTIDRSFIDPNACTNYADISKETQSFMFRDVDGTLLRDGKARVIGARLTLTLRRYVTTKLGLGRYNVKPGDYYALHTISTRDGEEFGPSFNWSIYTTTEERDAAIAKYLKAAEARARKTAVNRAGD